MAAKTSKTSGSSLGGAATPSAQRVKETSFEAIASICSVLVVGMFSLTLLGQNFVIPSGSMKNTLLVGDHLLVDRITLAPPSKWMPLVHYREPQRGDIVVFIRPAPEPEPDADGNPQYLILVKRLIGVPGDHIHLHNGIVFINGAEQPSRRPPKVSILLLNLSQSKPTWMNSHRLCRRLWTRMAPSKAGLWSFPVTSRTATWLCRLASTS